MKRRLSVAIVAACPFPCQRGTPVRIFRTAEALGRRGRDVHVVTYHLGDPLNTDAFTVHRTRNVKSYQQYGAGPTFGKFLVLDPLLAAKLYRVLTTRKIDLIHAHHYEGLLVSLLVSRFTRHPVIYDAHTILESELPSYAATMPGVAKRVIGRGLDGWLPGRADHTIAVTTKIKDALTRISSIAASQITVIPNGVEHGPFRVVPGQVQSDGVKRLIYTGNFAEFQRIDLLLRIFREVLNQRPDVRLVIVSQFPFDEFEPMARELGIRDNIDVVQAGFDEVPRYLAQADIAMNPRDVCDGLPQKLLNYMAAGKPIVSFEGSAELLEHGQTAFVVQNGNIAAFSQGVLRLLQDQDLASRLGSNARHCVMTELTWEKAAERVEMVYAQVLAGARHDSILALDGAKLGGEPEHRPILGG